MEGRFRLGLAVPVEVRFGRALKMNGTCRHIMIHQNLDPRKRNSNRMAELQIRENRTSNDEIPKTQSIGTNTYKLELSDYPWIDLSEDE